MITVSVRCAVFTTGSRKAWTPLLTASTPVIAVQPLENALINSQTLIPAAGGVQFRWCDYWHRVAPVHDRFGNSPSNRAE